MDKRIQELENVKEIARTFADIGDCVEIVQRRIKKFNASIEQSSQLIQVWAEILTGGASNYEILSNSNHISAESANIEPEDTQVNDTVEDQDAEEERRDQDITKIQFEEEEEMRRQQLETKAEDERINEARRKTQHHIGPTQQVKRAPTTNARNIYAGRKSLGSTQFKRHKLY